MPDPYQTPATPDSLSSRVGSGGWLKKLFISIALWIGHLLVLFVFFWIATNPVLAKTGLSDFSRFTVYYGFLSGLAILLFDVVAWFLIRNRWRWFFVSALAIPLIMIAIWFLCSPALRPYYSLSASHLRRKCPVQPVDDVQPVFNRAEAHSGRI